MQPLDGLLTVKSRRLGGAEKEGRQRRAFFFIALMQVVGGQAVKSAVEERVEPRRRIGRSVGALAAGFVVNVVLSFGTDAVFQSIGLMPTIGHAMNNSQSLLAAAYRTLYGVISSYAVARLAPYGPLGHALLGGAIGTVLATAGAVGTWNLGLGPHWYPVSLALTALPSAWAGGKLCVWQRGRRA